MKTTTLSLLTLLLAPLSPLKAAVVTMSFPDPVQFFTFESETFFHPTDLNSDGLVDFTFLYSGFGSSLRTDATNRATTLRDKGVPTGYPQLLSAGYLVGADPGPSGIYETNWENSKRPNDFDQRYSTFGISSSIGPNFSSIFPDGGGRGAIGLEFHAADGIHYGYFDLSGGDGYVGVHLNGWAYESEPGLAITAGSVPEPTAPALSVAAAGALMLLRRKPPAFLTLSRPSE